MKRKKIIRFFIYGQTKSGHFLPINQVHWYKFPSNQAEISDTICSSKSVLQLLSIDTATEIMSQVVYTVY